MTVHPRACNVAFAASPVALGVDDVPPDKFTVLLLYAVVPPVPSNAANDTSMPSTLAWSSFIPVIVKLPPMDLSVAPIEKVTRFAAVIVNVVATLIIAGNDNVVTEAADNAIVDPNVARDVNVIVVADANVGPNIPATVANAGKLNVVNEANIGCTAPTTVFKLVIVKVVNAAKVGVNAP